MSYNYQTERPKLLTPNGISDVEWLRGRVRVLCEHSGAIRLQEAAEGLHFCDSWYMLACFDRLVELGELVEVTRPGEFAQHRIFVRS